MVWVGIRSRAVGVAALLTLCLVLAGVLAVRGQWRFSPGGSLVESAGATPYLGITYVQLSHELAARHGVGADEGALVTEAAGDGPARAAGIRAGDVLLSADGVPVVPGSSLVQTLAGRRPGQRVTLHVLRESTTFTVELSLGARR